MNEYNYVVEGFLTSDSELMRQTILGQPSLSPTFLYLNTESKYVSVFFSERLDPNAEATLTALVSGYTTSVSIAKTKKLLQLQAATQGYIEARYNFLVRVQLLNLYTLAIFDGLVNRAAYIRPGIDWLNSILKYSANTANAIQALNNVAEIQAYPINISGNVGADPLLTVNAAVLISD